MKFNFKIQPYQTDAVEATCGVFAGQPYQERTRYIRDLGRLDGSLMQQQRLLVEEIEENVDFFDDTGYKNAQLALTDAQLLENIRKIQLQGNIKQSPALVKDLGRLCLDIEMETGERVIIVMGAVNVMKPRVSGTLNKYILCIA